MMACRSYAILKFSEVEGLRHPLLADGVVVAARHSTTQL